MHFERLVVGGFGRLPAGLELELTPGLNLVLAPNERGKTTLGDFIKGLLYGFGKRVKGVHPYEPWQGGGDTGGEAVYRLADGRAFTLGRHLNKRGEDLSLRDVQGRLVDLAGGQPGDLHLGCGQGVFLTVSRIGLDDLQQSLYASQRQDQQFKVTRNWLAGYFFAEAATRGEVANPVGVLQAWGAEREALYSRDRRRGKQGGALRERISAAGQDLAQARGREEQARQARDELRALAGEQAALDKQRAGAAQDLKAANQLLERAKDLARREQLFGEIAVLEKQGLATAEDQSKARDLEREAVAAEARVKQAAQDAARAKNKATELAGGLDPEELGRDLEGLASRLAGLKADQRHLTDSQQRLERRSQGLADQWGLDAPGLAGLAAELPYKLQGLRESEERARQEAVVTEQALSALPPLLPGRVWLLGLALILLIGGSKFTVWAHFALMPWWFLAIGGLLLLGGLGLGIYGFMRWQKARKLIKSKIKLEASLAKAQADAQATGQALSEALETLPALIAQADPAALAAARAEALGLEQERAALVQDQAGFKEKLAHFQAQLSFIGFKSGDDPEQVLADFRRRCAQAGQALAEAGRQEVLAAQEQAKSETLRRDLRAHLQGLGFKDSEALARARQRRGQVEKLGAALAEVEKGLGETGKDQAAVSPETAQQQVQQTLAKEAELAGRIRQLVAQQASLNKEIEHLLGQESAAQAQARLEDLEQRQRDLVRRHDTLALAEALLGRAMDQFRLEAQPGLLKKAGEYLSLATGGAYQWLGTDLFDSQPGKEPEIQARSGLGAPERQAQVLSRGTRDQLYLCLRLALAQEMTSNSEPLPLILDDPLVNFDDSRLAATLEMLCKVATERQVLLLTCHQQQAEILQGLCECRMLEIV